MKKPTFISRFALKDLEACFGPRETWGELFGDPSKRPKAFVLRDSLRGRFSPLNALRDSSRFKQHILGSGNNSRMNTILTELAAYTVPVKHYNITLTCHTALGCCGAANLWFTSHSLGLLSEEMKTSKAPNKGLVAAVTKALSVNAYSPRPENGMTGLIFSLPYKYEEFIGDTLVGLGFYRALSDDKTTTIYFKDIVTETQKNQFKSGYTMPKKPLRLGDPQGTLSTSYGYNPSECHPVAALRNFSNQSPSNLSADSARNISSPLQILILRTRGGGMSQIEANYWQARKMGFVPLTEDGLPYLNGNYKNTCLHTRHWLLPMGRVNPNYKG